MLKRMILSQMHETCVALKFNKEESKRIVEYTHETYFLHLRLYEYVLNNKTASEIKRINFT